MDGGRGHAEMEPDVVARGDDLLNRHSFPSFVIDLKKQNRKKQKTQPFSSSVSLPVLHVHKSFHRLNHCFRNQP